METTDHLKGISHERPHVDSIFDFITRTTASNITTEALEDIITNLIKQNIRINKKSINGCDSLRCNTLNVFSTTDQTSDIDNTQQQNKKGQKGNNKSNSSLQHSAPSFNQSDINTLCCCEQLAPENTADTTSLNTTTEISRTIPTDIQNPLTTNNLDGTSNFTQNSKGAGFLLYIPKDIPSKALTYSSNLDIETLLVEINLGKRKWFLNGSCNPNKIPISHHLECLNSLLDEYSKKYENYTVIGDFNVNTSDSSMKEFCSLNELKNLINEATCYKRSEKPTCIDLILTNQPTLF